MAGQLEREVGLDRDADVRRSAGIVAPAAVLLLLREDVVGGLANPAVLLAAEEGHEQDPFGFEDGVALELADPVAVRLLPAEQAEPGAGDSLRDGVARPRRGERDGWLQE